MSMANTIETNSTVKTTAVFSKNRKDRYLLKAEWDSNKKSLAIIMTYPSSADELIFDQITMLVRNGAVARLLFCSFPHQNHNRKKPKITV